MTSGPTLAHLTGLTLRQIQHWTTAGYLTPTTTTRTGSGHPRDYPPDQVTKAWLMATLIEELGCTPHAANMVANDLTTARKHGLKAIPLGPFDLGYEYLLCGLCADWRGPGLQGEAVHPECLAEALRDDQPRRVQDVPDPAGRFS